MDSRRNVLRVRQWKLLSDTAVYRLCTYHWMYGLQRRRALSITVSSTAFNNERVFLNEDLLSNLMDKKFNNHDEMH